MCTLFTKKSLHVSANCPLRPTTADHPGSLRAPQSGFSFLDSDTTRWQQWIISRACLFGDSVPGTSRFSSSHGTHVCAHMEPLLTWNPLVCTVCTVCTYGEQCAQCAQKNANCVKSVQIVTILCTLRLFTKYFRHGSAASGSLSCPGNRPAALTRPMGRWGGRWFCKLGHESTCVSAP